MVSEVEDMCVGFSACRGDKDTISAFKLSSPALAIFPDHIKQIRPKIDIGFGFLS